MSYGAMMAQFGLRLATLFIPSVPPLLQPRSALIINVVIVISEETSEGRNRRSVPPSVRATEVHRGVGPAARPSLRCSPRGASNPNIHERNARYTMTKPSGSAAAMTPACCIVLLRPLKKCGWTE